MGILSFSATVAIASAASLGGITGITNVQDALQVQSNESDAATWPSHLIASGSSSSVCNAELTAQNPLSRINLRSYASVNASQLGYGLVGDRVSILDETRAADGYTWYNVRFPASRAEGWIRGDLVNVSRAEENCTAQSESSPTPSDSSSSDSSSSEDVVANQLQRGENRVITPIVQPDDDQFNAYTQEEIDFFLDIAMGTEFGGYSRVVRKWNSDIKVRVFGSLTSQDQTTIRSVIDDLNRLLDNADTNSIDIELLSASSREAANFEIYIVPQDQFRRYEPYAPAGQLGFAWPRWHNNNEIYTSRVFVTSTGITQRERSHLIREEFTQSLGLMRDTENSRYQNSIFYQWWTDTSAFAELDETIISMLYRSDITPGMNSTQVASRLRTGTITAATKENESFFERALDFIRTK